MLAGNTKSFTYAEIIDYMEENFTYKSMNIREVTQKNTGRTRTCIYLDGSLAGKENNDGSYRLCNQFC